MIDMVTREGVRLLTYDRPGYGDSTRRPGRSVADCAADVAALADAQGWARFGVWGASGGGPHVLACATLLPDRVTRCAALVSTAPYLPEGSTGGQGLTGKDWFAGMSAGNVAEFTAALQGEPAYRPLVQRLGREAMAMYEKGEAAVPPGYDLPESDLAEWRRLRAKDSPGRLERTRAMWLDGVDGWIDDILAVIRPWGVDLTTVQVPVTIWYGPDDVLVPRHHAEWLIAHVPGAQRRELPGGHAISQESIAEVLGWVSR